MGNGGISAKKGNNDNSGKEKLWKQKEIRAAIICSIIAVALLALVLHCSSIQAENSKVYNINFNGDPTFKDEVFTTIVSNNPNNTGFISIYGLNITEKYLIFPTYLTNKQGDILELENDDFKIISNGEPIVLQISPSSIASGSYDGWILVKNEESQLGSIPITAETQPLTLIATLWVLVGVFVSLALWEIIKYVKRKEAEAQKKKLEAEAQKKKLEAEALNIQNLNALNAASLMEANNLYALAFEELKESAYWAQIATGLERRWSKWRSFVKIFILEFGSVAFGIAIGFLGIYSNTAVTNLLVIEIQDLMILLGLGLGIGSLKEFVDKSS